MKHKRVLSTWAASLAAGIAAFAALLLLAVAAASAPTQAQAVAQSYIADTSMQAGMIVRLADDKSKVASVSQSDESTIFGLVVRPNDAPLSLSENKPGQQVYVATAGKYQVLVSSQNGYVKEGDYVVLSVIEGIGMKADSSSQFIIGKAVEDFNAASTTLTSTTVKDTAGNERTVKIGYVKIDISVGRNPLHKGSVSNVPGFLQKAADTIADKPVTPLRIYLGVMVILVAGIIVSIVLYAGIRTSIISLGRNPLARKSIVRNLFRVVLLGLTILIVGVFAVYLILKL